MTPLLTPSQVAELLSEHPNWSNRLIAANVGTHHSRVAPVRKLLVASGVIPPISVRIYANGRIVNTDHSGNVNRVKKENGGVDLAGRRFGRLVVLRMDGRNGRYIQWLCRCDCGAEVRTRTGNLTNGYSRSCGCYGQQKRLEANRTHGKTDSRAYSSWLNMRARCLRPQHPAWNDYGGRGISVCDRWATFAAFYADMGDPPDGHTLDRIDVNGNYEPSNCRWATDKTQANNTRANRRLEFDGQARTMKEWSEFFGINYWTLRSRLRTKPLAEVARDLMEHS